MSTAIDYNEQVSDELMDKYNPIGDENKKKWIDQVLENGLNEKSLRSLLDSLGFELVSWRELSESEGNSNAMYAIVSKKEEKEQDMVLKIVNTQGEMYAKRTCEATAMLFVQKHSKIPVPRIFSHSNDPATSSLGCKYVLMERAQGQLLCDVFAREERDTRDYDEKIYTQMAEFSRQMRALPQPQEPNVICFFDANMRPLQPGPFTKPFTHEWDYLNTFFSSLAVHFVESFKRYAPLAAKIRRKWTELEQLVESTPSFNRLNFNDPKVYDHGDWNSSNIFVNPETYDIEAIVDWEVFNYGYQDANSFVVHEQFFVSDSAMDKMLEHFDRVLAAQEWYERPRGLDIRRFLKRTLVKILIFPMFHNKILRQLKQKSEELAAKSGNSSAHELGVLKRQLMDKKALELDEYFDERWDREIEALKRLSE